MESREHASGSSLPGVLPAWGVALALVIVAAGLVLRFHDAGSALLGPDELHAPRVARTSSYWEILGSYQNTDHSAPYSMYTRALMDADAFTETTYRFPAMLCAALLLLVPFLFRRWLGAAAILVALALLASDPMGVYFALVGRPYAPTSLALVLAFRSWLSFVDEPAGKGGWGFVCWSALAVFLHLFCVFPIAVLGMHGVVRAVDNKLPWRPLLIRGFVLVGLVVAFLAPGLDALLSTRLAKVGEGDITSSFVADAWSTVVGQVPALGWILPALMIVGSVAAWRSGDRMGRLASALLLFQLLAVMVSRPHGPPPAWARYLHLIWPIALLLAAQGLVALVRLVRAPAASAVVAAVALAVFVPARSPQAYFDTTPSPYRANDLFMLFDALELPEIPESYQKILDDPGRGDLLIECPDVSNLAVRWVPIALQRLHKMRLVLAVDYMNELREAGMHLDLYIDVRSPEDLMATGARYLVLYPDAQFARMGYKLRSEFAHDPPDSHGFQLFMLDQPIDRSPGD